MRHGAEAEDIRPNLFGEFGCVSSLLRITEFGGGVIQALLIDVTDPGHLKPWIRVEGSSMMHPTLAHADHQDGVSIHGVTYQPVERPTPSPWR